MVQKPSICFVALNAYNVLSGRKDIDHIGGAEVQQVRIASWLVQKGYRVSFVTLDHGQPDGIDLDGIRVFKAYVKDEGICYLRFLYPRWSSLWSAMSRVDADIYYQRTAENETGQVALWCRRHHKKFVFAVASDSDCSDSLFALNSRMEKTFYRIGLRLAHAIIAQTKTQQNLLSKNRGLESILVRNCGWQPTSRSLYQPPSNEEASRLRVLWVSRFTRNKRLEWFLEVAERCPDVSFEVVGAAGCNSEYSKLLIERAAGIANIKMHGSVPYSQMGEYYHSCHLLCCTSAYEGFPNTFLEAWSLGVPVISTFDPDGVIASKGLGLVARNVEGIITCLRKIDKSPDILIAASKAAHQYFMSNHAPDVCLPEFERLLLRVAGFINDDTV